MPYIDVVEGVCRFVVHQHGLNLRPVINILDMHIFDEGDLTTRHEAIVDQAQIINDEWCANVMPHLTDSIVFDSVSWLDLDSADGETGENNDNAGTNGSNNTPATPNVAILVHKQITATRGTRSGRLYLSGIAEADVDGNGAVIVGDFQPGMDDFLAAINQDGGLGTPSYTSRLVVVHAGPKPKPIPVDDVIVEGSFSTVSSFLVDPVAATQRRRLRS